MTLPVAVRFLIGPLVAILALALAWGTDLPRSFGAHPWWATDVLWMGGGVGILAGALACLAPRWTGWVFAIATITAFAAARWGGLEFAASYAENQFAGLVWYWGWLGTCAALAAALTRLATLD